MAVGLEGGPRELFGELLTAMPQGWPEAELAVAADGREALHSAREGWFRNELLALEFRAGDERAVLAVEAEVSIFGLSRLFAYSAGLGLGVALKIYDPLMGTGKIMVPGLAAATLGWLMGMYCARAVARLLRDRLERRVRRALPAGLRPL